MIIDFRSEIPSETPFEYIVESRTTQGRTVNAYLREFSKFLPKGIHWQYDSRYELFRLMDVSGRQMGVAFKMPDGRRLVMRIDRTNDDIFQVYKGGLDKNLFAVIDESNDKHEITFWPTLSDKEISVLRLKVHPTKGYLVVVQGEYAVLGPKDQNLKVATYASEPCRSALVFDSDRKLVALAHIDFDYDVGPAIRRMTEDLMTEGAKSDELSFNGTRNFGGSFSEYTIRSLFSDIKYDLPDTFSFDSLTGKVDHLFNPSVCFDDGNHRVRTSEKQTIRLQNNVPCTRVY